MRGRDAVAGSLFIYVDLEKLVRSAELFVKQMHPSLRNRVKAYQRFSI